MKMGKFEISNMRYFVRGKDKKSQEGIIRDIDIKDSVFELKSRLREPLGISSCLSFICDIKSPATFRFFKNGYQSWSFSDILDRNYHDKPARSSIVRVISDDPYVVYKKGELHSHSFSYLKSSGSYLLIGSLEERNGLTRIYLKGSELRVERDLSSMPIEINDTLAKIFIGYGENLRELFSRYVSRMETPFQKGDEEHRMVGWTSWYYYYRNVSEDDILENLNEIEKKRLPLDYVQIDDGYERAVGDWLEINERFPHGMKFLANEIKSRGYKSGIWIAPFIVEKDSRIISEHPTWLLREGKKKKMVRAGYNPLWSGSFYALDLTHEEVRRYLKKVFSTMFDEWGYDMVKIDFIYAGALKGEWSNSSYSRAKAYRETLEMIRKIAGDRLILGCGAPLVPGIGVFDACRVGEDVAPQWKNTGIITKLLNIQSAPSTYSSLRNVIVRWFMGGTAFLNDPDVIMLRKNETKLTMAERKTLAAINTFFGDFILFSDNLKTLGDQEIKMMKYIIEMEKPVIEEVSRVKKNVYKFNGELNDRGFFGFVNLSDKTAKFEMEPGDYDEFSIDGNWKQISSISQFDVKPHETRIFVMR